MKDLIIGTSTRYGWEQLKNWVLSIKSTSFKGDLVLVVMECDQTTVDKLQQEGVKVVTVNKTLDYRSKIPVHVERFIHMYHYLKSNEYRYVVSTDVKDVIFQSDPIDYIVKNIGDKKLMCASESLIYKNEPWGNDNLMQTFGKYIYNEFHEKEIFNVGTLAGEHKYIKDLMLSLFLSSINRPIPIVDQATYNVMMHTEPWLTVTKQCRSEDGWACQLGTTGDPNKIEYFKPNLLENTPVFKEGKVYTSNNKLFSIVHQYDRVPVLKEAIDARY
jgi:hypothetical protein